MRKLFLLFWGVVFFAVQALAQQRTITGKVTDEKGNPVANVSVLVRGTTTGTTSKADGTYSLAIPANAKVVIVSDGVWGVFPPKEFEAALLESLEPQDLADRLVRQALQRSTSDNATALVMKLETRDPKLFFTCPPSSTPGSPAARHSTRSPEGVARGRLRQRRNSPRRRSPRRAGRRAPA